MKNGKDPEPHQESADPGHRTERQEVTKGVAPESVLNCIKGGECNDSTQNQPKKYYFWENWKATWGKWEAIEKFTFVLLVFTFFSSTSDVYQSYMMRETLVASQRPAVHLGLPDGKIADFVLSEGKERLILYFRNYGQTTARNTVIETWPIIGEPVFGSTSGAKIPPPQTGGQGPDLPPGFPDTRYQSPLGVTREELALGKKNLMIVGRIQYADSFREYCDVFSIRYARETQSQFAFVWGRSMGGMDLCGKSTVIYSLVTVPREDENAATQDPYNNQAK